MAVYASTFQSNLWYSPSNWKNNLLHYNFQDPLQNYILSIFHKAGLEKAERKAIGRRQRVIVRWLIVGTEHSVLVTTCSLPSGLRIYMVEEKPLKLPPGLFWSAGQWNTSFPLEHVAMVLSCPCTHREVRHQKAVSFLSMFLPTLAFAAVVLKEGRLSEEHGAPPDIVQGNATPQSGERESALLFVCES